jgi:hypothetical protein
VTLFRADEAIAAALGRGRAGVAARLAELGLRCNSTRPWSELEDGNLASRYGAVATAAIAGELGRSCAAVYGIPNKDQQLRVSPLHVIETHVADFLDYAAAPQHAVRSEPYWLRPGQLPP